MKMMLSKKVKVLYSNVGGNIESILLNKLKDELEGKCNNQGYIKPNTLSIITYSSGIIKGNDIIFDVSYECQVCRPVLRQPVSRGGFHGRLCPGFHAEQARVSIS